MLMWRSGSIKQVVMPSDLVHTIDANAAELRRLNARIHETLRTRNRSAKDRETWERACADFHAQYDRLAFPGGYSGALDRILAGDRQTIEAALCFVELRPFFFRSGYMFKDLLRKLKRAPLDAASAQRLELVLKAYADYRGRRRRAVGRHNHPMHRTGPAV
jgi:hypothetical protein